MDLVRLSLLDDLKHLSVTSRKHLPLHDVPENTMYDWPANSCWASSPAWSSAVGADACPSAQVDTFAPTSLVREEKMCYGVLATLLEMSTWCEKPMSAPLALTDLEL